MYGAQGDGPAISGNMARSLDAASTPANVKTPASVKTPVNVKRGVCSYHDALTTPCCLAFLFNLRVELFA
jgi:hypothetical protein